MTAFQELPKIRELDSLIAAGRLREYSGPPFPVDPGSRHAGFPPLREECTPVEPLSIPLLRRAVEQPATPFGPARSEFVDAHPPLAIVVARATEYMYQVMGFEWAVSFDLFVGVDRLGTFFGNRWGWELDLDVF